MCQEEFWNQVQNIQSAIEYEIYSVQWIIKITKCNEVWNIKSAIICTLNTFTVVNKRTQ